MLREAFKKLLTGEMSRRGFIRAAGAAGIGAAAAGQFANIARAEAAAPALRLENVTGGDITCETLRAWGVRHVFGNTGAYEAGFVDALVGYPDIQYVLGLHEGPVMAMADGYARATGRTAFVNVHSITGTANALGLIVNAAADASPVVVSVGFSGRDGDTLGVFTETDKLEMVPALYTKLSFRASEPANLAESMRHAFQLAELPPSGPVFIGVPMDVWSGKVASADIIPADRSRLDAVIPPDPVAVARAVDLLASAENPLLVAGAELPRRTGGLEAMVALADRLGATVSGDTAASRSSLGFPADHPRYLGDLRRAIAPATPFDVVVLAGTSRLSLARGGHPLIPTGAQIIEFGLREDHLARSWPADLLLYADPGETLRRIDAGLAARSLDKAKIASRAAAGAVLANARRKAIADRLADVHDDNPIAPERLAQEIDKALAADALVVTEGVSSDGAIRDHVRFDQVHGGRRHLISSGGSLGWGVGAGVGAKLGVPDKQVAVLLGDGSFQFGMQALWTAARFKLAMIVVIFNNRAYQANRWAINGLRARGATSGHYIGISLDDPDIDHVGIARAYGHDGERVTDPDELPAALARAVAAERAGGTWVLDVVIAKRGPGAEAEDWHEGVARRG